MGLISKQMIDMINNDEEAFGYSTDSFMNTTDFPLFDYLNGQATEKFGKIAYEVGIDSGKSIMVVGKAGSGKTTLAVQLAYSIVKKYDDSNIFYYDFENSCKPETVKRITGLTDENYNDKIIYKNTGIYSETILQVVKQLAKFKIDNKKALLVDNAEGKKDKNGNIIKILPPTVVLIDSLAAMKTKEIFQEDGLSSLTMGARNANTNKDIFTKLVQPCMEANIILIVINHVTTNLNLGGITPPVAQTRFMKNTDAVSGGAAVQYLMNLWIAVEAGDKLDPGAKTNPYGDLKGYRTLIKIIKSRNAAAGKVVSLVFNQISGYDEDLSELEFLKANGAILGSGVGCYLEGLDTVKFRFSTFKNKLETVPEFKARFKELVDQYLKASVQISSKVKSNIKEDEKSTETSEEAPTAEAEAPVSDIENITE